MRSRLIFLAVFLILSLLIGCRPSIENIAQDFKGKLESENYEEAKEIYSKYKIEHEFQKRFFDIVDHKADEIKEQYINKAISFEEALRAMEALNYITESDSVYVGTVKEFITTIGNSRKQYESGLKFIAEKKYAEAIEAFKGVIKEDENYNDAQEKIIEAFRVYRDEKVEEAKKLVAANRLDDAIQLLEGVNSLLPGDPYLENLINEYQQARSIYQQARLIKERAAECKRIYDDLMSIKDQLSWLAASSGLTQGWYSTYYNYISKAEYNHKMAAEYALKAYVAYTNNDYQTGQRYEDLCLQYLKEFDTYMQMASLSRK